MLPSRPSFVTCINVFGEVQTAHMNLGSSCISSRDQIPGFHTPGFVQGVEAKLNEHRRIAIMFQQVVEYDVQMTNILLRLFDLEITKQVDYRGKDYVQNLQGVLEKEQKFKAELQDRKSDNSQVLAELQVARQKINNMEKQSKDLKNIILERDSLQATLKEIDVNYWGFKAKKDTLSIKHNKLQKNYKNMEETLSKQQKEVEELRVDNANAYQAKNEI